MGSINFYFKNCTKSTQNILRPAVMRKIKSQLNKNGFKDYEDIIEYVDTEALPNEKEEIMGLFK